MVIEFYPNDSQEERIARFIVEKNFTLRRCRRYVKNNYRKKKKFFKEDDCFCGKSVTWHLKNRVFDKHSKQTEWSINDTVPYPCNTFGELTYRAGYGVDQANIVPGASAKYIRLDGQAFNPERQFEDVFTLMTDRNLWGLPAPKLIIEVTGSANPLPYVDQRAIERFNTGLIAAAKNANAWIVTGGTNCGVMKLCGDAVTRARMTNPDKTITCVGIVSWGIINGRESLVSSDDSFFSAMGPKSPVILNTSSELSVTGNGHVSVIGSNSDHSGTRNRTISENSTTSYEADIIGKWPANYKVEKQESDFDEPWLNPGHNAFLFVDKGRDKEFGEEIEFRAHFLHFLSKKTISGASNGDVPGADSEVTSTPLVLVVIGGGPNTLKTVKVSTGNNQSQEQDNEVNRRQSVLLDTAPKRPVIVLPGFGGAADVLAFAYAITAKVEDHDQRLYRTAVASSYDDSKVTSVFPVDFDERVRRHPAFSDLTLDNSEEKKTEIIAVIRECLVERNLITIVDLFDTTSQSTHTLDHAILNAIFKSNLNSDAAKTFQLAQLWRRCDIAQQIFRRHEADIRKSVDIKRSMTRAIEYGEASFFAFFLDYGLIDLNSYLTMNQMRTFYEDLFIKRVGKARKLSCIQLFRSLLMNGTNEETLSDLNNPKFMENVGEVLASLLQCYMDNTFTGETHRRQKLTMANSEMLSTFDSYYSDQHNPRRHSLLSDKGMMGEPYATSERDLFILLLLLNRQEMAVKVWKSGHDHLGSALMAAIFLKSLHREASRLDMMDLSQNYDDHATEWQDRAISLLSYCYEQEPLRCNRLISRSLHMWQGLTIFEMAYFGKKKRIMEHAAIQMKLGQIWHGRMATFTKDWLIYLTVIPPLTPFLIFRIRFEEPSVFYRQTSKSIGKESGNSTLKMSTKYDAENQTRLGRSAQFYDTSQVNSCRGCLCLGRIAPEVTAAMASTLTGNMEVTVMSKSYGTRKYNDKRLLKPTMTLCSPTQAGQISFPTSLFFLYSSPIVKFLSHSLALLVFLMAFSALVLIGVHTDEVSGVEIFIWASAFIYFVELLRESFFERENFRLSEKLVEFFSDSWNMTDVAAFLLLIAAIIQRFTIIEEKRVYPRTTYAVCCVLYWFKSLHIFYVTRRLGPKVQSLFRLLWDVGFFLLMYVIILLTFSLPIHSLLRPESQINSFADFWDVLIDVAYHRMWQLFVTGMDDARRLVEGNCRLAILYNSPSSPSQSAIESVVQNLTEASKPAVTFGNLTDNSTDKLTSSILNGDGTTEYMESCSIRNVVAIILYIIYLLLTNVVLCYMLIAMFAYTVSETTTLAERVWRYNHYRSVREYYYKPVLPGMLMALELIVRLGKSLRSEDENLPPNNAFKEYYSSMNDFDYRKLEMFERSGVELITSENPEKFTLMKNVSTIQEKLHHRIDMIEEKLLTINGGRENSQQ